MALERRRIQLVGSQLTEQEKLGLALTYKGYSPIPINDNNLRVTVVTKKGGYNQIEYRFTGDDGKNYVVRWHTATANVPVGTEPNWRIDVVTPGTPTGQTRVEEVLIHGTNGQPNYTVSIKVWKDAVDHYNNGTATAQELEMLQNGHWPNGN